MRLHTHVFMSSKRIMTIGDLKEAISHLSDNDLVVIETTDLSTGDAIDLYPFYVDEIEGIELADGSIVSEVRFCQMDNTQFLKHDDKKKANYWVIETGSDCDGVYTIGRVYAFETETEAYDWSDEKTEWSDGMRYPVIALFSSVVDYCNDHNLNPENYKQV